MRTPRKVPNKQAKKKKALAKHTRELKHMIATPVVVKKGLRD